MTFDEWLNRPVYKVQCFTFKLAKELLGLPKGDFVTTGNHPIVNFRAAPAYRDAKALHLRKTVADIVRQKRNSGTYQLQKVKP